MKKIVNLVFLFCTIMCLYSFETSTVSAAIVDSGVCGDDLTWEIDDNGVLTIDGTGDMYDFTRGAAPWSEYRKNYLSSVVINDGVTSIGDYAFYFIKYIPASDGVKNDRLKSIDIPDSVTRIGNYALYFCYSLESIEVPANCGGIDLYTCWSLNNIEIPDSFSGGIVLYNCPNITEINIPKDASFRITECPGLETVTLADGISKIPNGAFYECVGLKNINIPNSVVSIGDSAFYNCSSLESIDIPDSVCSIGERAFYGCKFMENIILPDELETLGDYCFEGCSKLEYLHIPTKITSNIYLGDCNNLKTISVASDNAEYIVENNVLFNKDKTKLYFCSRGKEGAYKIPNTVEDIDEYAFKQCKDLTSVTIPASFTGRIIGDYKNGQYNLFAGCYSLINLYVDENNAEYTSHEGVLFDKEMTTLIRFPLGRTEYSVPQNITTIGYKSFSGATKLSQIELNEGLTTIDSYSFFGCTNLSNITIPNSVESLGSYAFYDCSKLNNIVLSDNITKLNDKTFYNCSNLTFIKCPNNINGLGSYMNGNSGSMFDTNLLSIVIPKSITYIAPGVFKECSNLTNVYYAGSEDEWNQITIYNSDNDYLLNAEIHYNSYYISYDYLTNGGTSSTTEYDIVSDGEKADLTPTAYKENSIFIGWHTNPDATKVLSSYKPTGNVTLYAIFKEIPSAKFEMLKDNYSFSNSRSSFGYDADYKIPLERYISVFGMAKGVQEFNSSDTWGGSCYGFASSTLAFFENQMEYNDYDSTAGSLYDIQAPETSEADLTKMIESYQISQMLDDVLYERCMKYGDMDGIIRAVENFEATGKEPIILCVFRDGGGHAVVPYKCDVNEDGSYSIYVYDNNYPDDMNRIVNISSDKNSFSYGRYTKEISYNYASTVYSEFKGISLMNGEECSNAIITINSNNVIIQNKNGISVENLEGAYEVTPVVSEYDTSLKKYVLPNDEYIIKNKFSGIDTLEVTIANENDYQVLTTSDINSTIVVGVDEISENTYAYIYSDEDADNTIKTLMSNGVFKQIEAACGMLGTSVISRNEVDVESDCDVIKCNGENVAITNSTLVGGMMIGNVGISVNNPVIKEDDFDEFIIKVKNNQVQNTGESINGKLSCIITNNSGEIVSSDVMAILYSENGQMLSVIRKKSEILGLSENYIDFGTINYSNKSTKGAYIKILSWDSSDLMKPLAESIIVEVY